MFEGALERIRRSMLVLMVPFSGAAWWRFGWRTALGFALRCLVAYVNFHWLKRGVQGLADRIVRPEGRNRAAEASSRASCCATF